MHSNTLRNPTILGFESKKFFRLYTYEMTHRFQRVGFQFCMPVQHSVKRFVFNANTLGDFILLESMKLEE